MMSPQTIRDFQLKAALTAAQFVARVRNLVVEAERASQTLGFAIVSVGQFQAYVGIFEKGKV